VNFGAAGKSPRWRSAVAVFATLAVLAALTGCWTLRSVLAAADSPQPVAATQAAVSQFDHGSSSTYQTNQKPFKSTGIKRDRPPTWSRSAPPEWSSPMPASMTTLAYPPGVPNSRAPAAPCAGQDLLTQFCVARC
jgi:hypothetical protein